jgi:hypothetical protein
MKENPPLLESRKSSEEELFYLKLARDEFAASMGRIEETAKYLIGAVGAVAGLLFAGLQVKAAVNPQLQQTSLAWPMILWGVSVFCAILVFFPLPYRHYRNAPDAIRRSFEKARWVKWSLLLASALSFAAGLLAAAFQF